MVRVPAGGWREEYAGVLREAVGSKGIPEVIVRFAELDRTPFTPNPL